MRLALVTIALMSALLLGSAMQAPAAPRRAPHFLRGTHAAGGRSLHGRAGQRRDRGIGDRGAAGGGCSWDTIDLANWGGPIPIEMTTFKATIPMATRCAASFWIMAASRNRRSH